MWDSKLYYHVLKFKIMIWLNNTMWVYVFFFRLSGSFKLKEKTIQTDKQKTNPSQSPPHPYIYSQLDISLHEQKQNITSSKQTKSDIQPLSIFITYPISVTRFPSSPLVTIPSPSLTYRQIHLIIPLILLSATWVVSHIHPLSSFHTHFSTMPFCCLCLPTQWQTSSPFLSPLRAK